MVKKRKKKNFKKEILLQKSPQYDLLLQLQN